MAGIKEIKNRIKSIQSTHQITKAMEIVSTTKYNKFSTAVKKSKPYSEAVQGVLDNISKGIKAERHPLFDGREEVKKIAVLVMSSDSGLCGGFNSGTMKALEKFIKFHKDKEIIIFTIGKKARDYTIKRNYKLGKAYISLSLNELGKNSQEISDRVVDGYMEREYDEVHIIYNDFISALRSDLTEKKLIPISRRVEKESPKDQNESNRAYIFEPDAENLLKILLPKYLNVELYQAILSNMASEHSARKNSMKNATENAEEILKTLNVTYNRQRQGAITQEITEIVGGVAALN